MMNAVRLRRRPARRRALRTAPVLGPAFVAAIAYVDPGNFATNFAAGSEFGYLLLWVIVAANVTAMLIQSLSAKLGLATGRNLPEVCRDTFPRRVSIGLWVQAECVAIATDLAEVIGGAVALYLLFGLPLPIGGLVTGVVAFGLLALQERGHRPFERAVAGLFAVIVIGFVITVLRVPIEIGPLAAGLVPGFAGPQSLLLATGILGATVMPHVIYLHSALTCRRDPRDTVAQRHRLLRAHRRGVLVAMGLAGLVNAAMLVVAAALFHGFADPGHRHPRRRVRRPGPRPRRPGGDPVRARAARVGLRVVGRGNLRGPGRDAGLRAAADPAVRSAAP